MRDRKQRLQANLARMLGAYRDWAKDLPEPSADRKKLAIQLSNNLPLSHGSTSVKFRNMCLTRSINSQRSMAVTGSLGIETDETFLGTDGDVFFYASIFRYPKSAAGFLFKANIEDRYAESVATPFDSGGARRLARFIENQAAVLAFVSEHEMPVPDFRRLLAEMLSTAFHSPLDYIQPEMPKPRKMLWWTDSTQDARGCTAEVRVPFAVELLGKAIEAVFIPKSLLSFPEVMSLIVELKPLGVKAIFIGQEREGGFAKMQHACFEYIRSTYGGARAI